MFLLGTILGTFIGMLLVACVSVDTINEYQSLVNESRQALRNAENEIECLVKEDKTLYQENKELRELLAEVADRAFCCPLDSEKIVLDKIKELVRDHQSEN